MNKEWNIEFLLCASAAQVIAGEQVPEELLYELYIKLAAHFDRIENSETLH